MIKTSVSCVSGEFFLGVSDIYYLVLFLISGGKNKLRIAEMIIKVYAYLHILFQLSNISIY